MKGKFFELNITKIESTCIFELNWEGGKKITVNLQYPNLLNDYYQQWKTAYLEYYRNLRGRKKTSGKGIVTKDFRSDLVNSHTKLLYEFHRWLFSPELVEIRREIVNAVNNLSDKQKKWVEVFLTCNPIEIGRLPWETWEIGTDLGVPNRIRIARNTANIRHDSLRPLNRKVRILAILGDNTGLNFDSEKEELKKFKLIAHIKVIGWTLNKNIDELKQEIVQNIASVDGWDILFFIGHSNESVLTGGELGIAPNASIFISEIEDALKLAKNRGLQFAVFNSCSGINIAESLINLGLSQVVVMREPINNKVAQEFFKQFLRSLSEYKDVHESLLDASKFLKQQEKRLAYPSTYLVPSLFRHPNAELFRIKPFGLWSIIKQWMPTSKEAKWVGLFLLISLMLQANIPNLLLEPRLFLQAFYRKVTLQIPSKIESLVVVKIDHDSLETAKEEKQLEHRYPLDYGYLSILIKKISDLNANIIGIDYILDQAKKQPKKADILNKSIRDSIEKNKTLFVFGYKNHQDEERNRVSREIASLFWSTEGDIDFSTWYVELPLINSSHCNKRCPLSYLLALSHSIQIQNKSKLDLPQPNLNSEEDFRFNLINKDNIQDKKTSFLYKLRLKQISVILNWFNPIIDFSIPPNKAYESIKACDLTSKSCEPNRIPKNLKDKIVLIIPGGYQEAGAEKEEEDNSPIPFAVAFWRGWGNGQFPNGEAHAYMIHHLLTQRLVIPIPDFLMILIAALLAKSVIILLLDNPERQKKIMYKAVFLRQQLFPKLRYINEQELLLTGLGIATTFYGVISLQFYITFGILFPYFLPSVIFWKYIRFALERKI
ncbi:MAG: CHASE2 domain-containing protein [Cyanobacteria bacterium J06633_8]